MIAENSENCDRYARWLPVVWALFLGVMALHPLVNNDLPLHLAIGDWIRDHGELPSRDPFSFQSGEETWVAHEWLFGVRPLVAT